jgi:hypothetical protein
MPTDRNVVFGGIGAISFQLLMKQMEAMDESSFAKVSRSIGFKQWFAGHIDPEFSNYRECLQIRVARVASDEGGLRKGNEPTDNPATSPVHVFSRASSQGSCDDAGGYANYPGSGDWKDHGRVLLSMPRDADLRAAAPWAHEGSKTPYSREKCMSDITRIIQTISGWSDAMAQAHAAPGQTASEARVYATASWNAICQDAPDSEAYVGAQALVNIPRHWKIPSDPVTYPWFGSDHRDGTAARVARPLIDPRPTDPIVSSRDGVPKSRSTKLRAKRRRLRELTASCAEANVGDIVVAFNNPSDGDPSIPNHIAQVSIPLWFGQIRSVIGAGTRPRLFADKDQADDSADGYQITWFEPKWTIPPDEISARRRKLDDWDVSVVVPGEKKRAIALPCLASWTPVKTCHFCGKTTARCSCSQFASSEFRTASTVGPAFGSSFGDVFTKGKILRATHKELFRVCMNLTRDIHITPLSDDSNDANSGSDVGHSFSDSTSDSENE